MEKKPDSKTIKKVVHKNIEHLKFDDLDPAALGKFSVKITGRLAFRFSFSKK